MADVEIEELGVGEHSQVIIDIEVLRVGVVQVLRGRDRIQVGDVLGHIGPAAAVVRHSRASVYGREAVVAVVLEMGLQLFGVWCGGR